MNELLESTLLSPLLLYEALLALLLLFLSLDFFLPYDKPSFLGSKYFPGFLPEDPTNH